MTELTHTDRPCRACFESSLEDIKKANLRFTVLMEMAREQADIIAKAVDRHNANARE